MTSDDAYNKLLDTVQFDLRHPDYDRVCQLAHTYFKYNTGVGIEEDLQQFSPREEDSLFEQRVNLTIAVTPAGISSIKKPYYKVPRTQPVTRKIVAKSDANKEAVTEIEGAIKNYYGGDDNTGGLDYYVQNRLCDLVFDDPNMWHIVEFSAFDANTQKPQPHPFEASAKQAINFEIVNNIVQWLIVAIDIVYKEKNGNQIKFTKGKKYTIYADNDAWTFEEIPSQKDNRLETVSTDQLIEIDGKGVFIVTHFDLKTKRVPATRIGYIADIQTNGRTFVNPYHDADCFLRQSIQDCSEFQISKRTHVFPQKLIRSRFDCPGENGERCDHGKLAISGTKCGKCRGTGKLVHTSGQDMVEIDMPDNKDELIPLSEYISYVNGIPIDIVRLQKELVDELVTNLHTTVFNSTVLLRKSAGAAQGTSVIDATATEIDHDMESVYDTLTPFAEKVSSFRIWITEMIAILTDNVDKVTIIDRPATKFKLKTRQDLYAERATLKTSGAPAFVIDSIDDELAQDVYADDADGLLRYMVKKEHYPFVGKSPEEIQQLLNSSTVLKRTKVLWNYYDEIFTELEREWKAKGSDFYLEKVELRQQAIDGRVTSILDQLAQDTVTAITTRMALIPGGGNSNNNPINNGTPTQTQQTAA